MIGGDGAMCPLRANCHRTVKVSAQTGPLEIGAALESASQGNPDHSIRNYAANLRQLGQSTALSGSLLRSNQ